MLSSYRHAFTFYFYYLLILYVVITDYFYGPTVKLLDRSLEP